MKLEIGVLARVVAVAAACSSPATGAVAHTVDSTGTVGRHSSIAIGVDGLPIVSYHNAGGQLRVAHCTVADCSSATLATLDTGGGAGAWTSIAIGSDDVAVIVYQVTFDDDLKIAHCDDTACSDAATFFVDPDLDAAVGEYTSIVMGAGDLPLISYYDVTNGALRVAACTTSACPVSTRTEIDDAADVGQYSSIALGVDGKGLISYFDNTADDLKVAHCDDAACTTATITPLDTADATGADTSIAIGSDGFGIIAYRSLTEGALRVAHCSNTNCTAATKTTIDEASTDVGRWTDIAIGDDGLPVISYWDQINGRLKLARCANVLCTSARVSSLVYGGTLGGHTSIAIDGSGQPVISFYDAEQADLRVAYPGLHSDGFEAGNLAGWSVSP